MKIFVELSGFGHYFLCTMFPVDHLETVIKGTSPEEVGHLLPEDATWEMPLSLDIMWRYGMDGALVAVQSYQGNIYDPNWVKLLWSPSKLEQAFLSHLVLSRKFGEHTSSTSVDGDRLAVFAGKANRGWIVRADLGPEMWDLLETPDSAPAILAKVNQDLGFWYEDQFNRACRIGEHMLVFSGVNGPTLQVNNPEGDGLWIAGARNSTSERQLYDHNTDSIHQAISHIVALALLQDVCRKHLAEIK